MSLFRYLLLTLSFLIAVICASAQTSTDTVFPVNVIQPAPDSMNTEMDALMADSVVKAPARSAVLPFTYDPAKPITAQVLEGHPYFRFAGPSATAPVKRAVPHGKETLFYVLIGMVLMFALLRLAFAKYVNDVFRLFFRTTLKQRQVRDQLIQSPLASLFFNGFFVATGGMYINLLLVHFGKMPIDFWLMYLYCCAGLAVIYFVKFIGLKLTGWILNVREASDSYLFIIFIINKVIGIFLLPVIVLLAFTDDLVYATTLLLSWVGLGIFLAYRFILAYSALRNQVRFNLFHFLLYFGALELAPLLLIYRLLLVFLQQNA